jgi:hypothetical protein
MQIEGAYIAEVMTLMEYVVSKEGPLIQVVKSTQTQHYFKKIISRNLFKAKRSKYRIVAQNIKEKCEEKR